MVAVAETVTRATAMCGDCRHFDAIDEHGRPLQGKDRGEYELGTCRRYAPRAYIWTSPVRVNPLDSIGLRPDVTALWPVVTYDEWCSEFAERGEA